MNYVTVNTKSTWEGKLLVEEGSPSIIRVGKLSINSVLHFMSGKRIVLLVELLTDEDDSEDSGSISTAGKLEYNDKKKEFLFEKYPLVDFLESFVDQKIKLQIELDRSVLSARMSN